MQIIQRKTGNSSKEGGEDVLKTFRELRSCRHMLLKKAFKMPGEEFDTVNNPFGSLCKKFTWEQHF